MNVELSEYGPAAEVRLSADVALALGRTGLVEVTPALPAGTWTLTPRGRVGAVHVTALRGLNSAAYDLAATGRPAPSREHSAGITVRVAPKVGVDRVMFLLNHADRRISWTGGEVGLAEDDDLLTLVATVFAAATEHALRSGLIQGYRSVEEALPVLRGRLRADEQLRRRHGLAVPVEVRYDEFGVDTDENQLLRAATERLLRLPELPRKNRRRLHRLLVGFADVTPLTRGSTRPRWQPTRLNARYGPALALAELVLAGSSFEHAAGEVAVSGFVVDMAGVFEDFLTATLGEALRRRGGSVRAQFRTHLDEAGEIAIRPDLVWFSPDGTPMAVIDAKYKQEKPAGFPDADLYQALAYATALDLRCAHLVYAAGFDPVRSHTVRHNGIRLYAHTLKLTLNPPALLARVDLLAEQIAAAR